MPIHPEIILKKILTPFQNFSGLSGRISPLMKEILALLLILFILFIHFSPMAFKGHTPVGPDTVGQMAAGHQVDSYNRGTGEKALWNPALFSGMPIYYLTFNNQPALDTLISLATDTPGRSAFVYYMIGAIGIYLLMRFLGVSILGAILAALAFTLMPHYEVLLEAGHFRKLRSIMLIPWVILAFEYLLRKGNGISMLLLILAFSSLILSKHYQIIFYTVCLMGFWGIGFLIQKLGNESWRLILKKTGLFSLAMLLSVLLGIQVLLPVREYAKYSTRESTTEQNTSGMSYEESTEWSFAPKELPKLLVPNYYGGPSKLVYQGKEAPFLQGQRIRGYWGEMPFSAGGEYLGILTFILAGLGIFYGFRSKNRYTIVLALFIVFALFLSFGRHLPFLYRIFFNLIPFFNKFRAPAMIFEVIYFGCAVLAGFGYRCLMDQSEKNRKHNINRLFFLFLLLIILSITPYLFQGQFSFEKNGDVFRYSGPYLNWLKAARYDLMKQDSIRLLLFSLGAGAMMYIIVMKRFNRILVFTILGAFQLIDLLTMNNRFLNNLEPLDKFEKTFFTRTKVDSFLLTDTSYHRIYSPLEDPFNRNEWSYYHQSIGGYNPAKLRIYQEVIKNCLQTESGDNIPENWNVLNMLNTKYIIVPNNYLIQLDSDRGRLVYQDNRYKVFRNVNVLPRAFFAGNYEIIAERSDRLTRLNQPAFDPLKSVILEIPFNEPVSQPDSSSIQIRLYEPDRISIDTYTDKSSLMVLSEIFYPAGWKAFMDGRRTEIFKGNHILRVLYVPEGSHSIELTFRPGLYLKTGRIAFFLHCILIACMTGLIVIQTIKKKRTAVSP